MHCERLEFHFSAPDLNTKFEIVRFGAMIFVFISSARLYEFVLNVQTG